ncbi:MAG TPA: DUF4157 domain-containing protein [Pyrinomonadaceae bacterium]|nr:DUF4157 domain-containing protein [Pyrinomonadaceae bacterium]
MKVSAQKQFQPQKQASQHSTRSSAKPLPAKHPAHPFMHLQRMVGNQTVRRLLQANARGTEVASDPSATTRSAHDFSRTPVRHKAPVSLQAKLTVNAPGDAYEREADRVSAQLMSVPQPQVQRACRCGGGCPGCRNEQAAHAHLQTKPTRAKDSGQIEAPPIVNEILRSPGRPLDSSTRAFMEPRFGRDFSHVRVHDDADAVTAAASVNAKAFTVGNAIVFGAGQYSPASGEGRRLLGHELTHVVQQSASASELRPQRLPSLPSAHVTQHSPGGLFRKEEKPVKEEKTVLEKEGVTDRRTVDEVDEVRRILIATLSNPKSALFPYIKDKLKRLESGKTKYKIEDVGEFAADYRKHAKRRNAKIDPSIKDKDLVQDIGGFYDPSLMTVFLKTRSNYCHAFHETIHSFSSPDLLLNELGGDLMEGLTQYFTDIVFTEQVKAVCTTHKYGPQLACARKLVGKIGFPEMASLFFLNDTNKLHNNVAKIGVKDKTELRQLGSSGICKKLSSPLP